MTATARWPRPCPRAVRTPTAARARPARPDDAGGEARADRRLLGEGATARPSRRCRASSAARRTSTSSPGTGSATSPAPTAPARSTPAERAAWLWAFQRDLVTRTRLGIPAIVHEECLTGLSAWKAATFPTPLAWGAAFDPELVARDGRARSAARCGRSASTRAWRRCSTSSATPGGGGSRSASPRTRTSSAPSARPTCAGCSRQGCTPRSSTSSATPRRGPAATSPRCTPGPRELADVLLMPFEMAILDGEARSVMHSYAEIDGLPVAADPDLLTGLLRDQWGFDGTVVADYFGVAFLHLLHHVAADLGEAAAQALAAGVDVELPTGDAYLAPLADRGARRVGSTRRWSTGRCCGRCARSRSWGCSTRPSTTSRRPRSTSTRPSTARSRPGWPRSRWCCSPTTASSRSRPGHGRRHRPERRPARGALRLLLVRQPRAPAAPRRRAAASRCRRCARRCAARVGRRRARRTPAAAGSTTATSPASPDAVAPAAPRPTSPCSSSATRPGSSGAAPSARAATATTWSCPACSASSSRPCSTRGRRWSSCCSPAGPTPSAGRWSGAPRWCRPSSPARRAGRRSRACSPGGSTPRAGCR